MARKIAIRDTLIAHKITILDTKESFILRI